MHVLVTRSMKPTIRIMDPVNLHTSNLIVPLVLLIIFSFANLPGELCVKMPRQCDTARRGSADRGGGIREVNLGATDGYALHVSMLVQCMMNE